MLKENHLADGSLLRNRYRIIRFLASGGFGNTYEAEDTRFGSHVAIKELFISGVCKRESDSIHVTISVADNIAPFQKQKERFIKEAERLRMISHPNVVKVSDYFEENGTAYYVMDYVRGCSLSELRDEKKLTEKKIVQYINQVLEALEAVHKKGLLHLDIKPSNIMIDENNRVILIDFGASKQIETVDGKSVSVSSGILGTPGYFPIEQSGSTKDELGEYTDIYAIGATLYNLVTGNTPPTSSELITTGLPDFHASESVAKAIRQAMQPNFKSRPQSVAEFRAVLNNDKIENDEYNIGDSSEGTETEVIGSSKSNSSKQKMFIPMLLVAVFLFAGIVVWLMIKQPEPSPTPILIDSSQESEIVIPDTIYPTPVIEIPIDTGVTIINNAVGSSPQTIICKGTIVDNETGEPLIGCTIKEKGTTNAVSNDLDGNYTITVKEGALLEYTYVGYAKYTAKAKANMGTIKMKLQVDPFYKDLSTRSSNEFIAMFMSATSLGVEESELEQVLKDYGIDCKIRIMCNDRRKELCYIYEFFDQDVYSNFDIESGRKNGLDGMVRSLEGTATEDEVSEFFDEFASSGYKIILIVKYKDKYKKSRPITANDMLNYYNQIKNN